MLQRSIKKKKKDKLNIVLGEKCKASCKLNWTFLHNRSLTAICKEVTKLLQILRYCSKVHRCTYVNIFWQLSCYWKHFWSYQKEFKVFSTLVINYAFAKRLHQNCWAKDPLCRRHKLRQQCLQTCHQNPKPSTAVRGQSTISSMDQASKKQVFTFRVISPTTQGSPSYYKLVGLLNQDGFPTHQAARYNTRPIQPR